jgi:transposase
MVFRRYKASTKISAVQMTLQNHSQCFIRDSLGVTVSRQSFSRWTKLFHKTQRVVCNPDEYDVRGQNVLLSAEEREFMIELVCNEPGLFLDEIQERLYNHGGTLLSMTTIQNTLVKKLCITLKKPNTVSINKSLASKYRWIAQMANMPAEFLVFTGVYLFDSDLHLQGGS